MQSLKNSFESNGYVVVEGMLSLLEVQELKDHTANMVANFDPEESRSVFTTTAAKEERDAYFLDSGDKIRFFWEQDALDADGNLVLPKDRAINKIGHAMHDLDPVFSRFSRSMRLLELLQLLGLQDPLLLQSMYIFKHPGIGGEVGWHQDQTYLYTSPEPVIGLWIALDDATIDNGCLWAIPGGHRGPLRSRFIRSGLQQTTENLDTTAWETAKKVPLEVAAGSVIVLHGLLPHMSEANTSAKPRHAYTLHLMDRGQSFSRQNWLQRSPSMPFQGFKV